MGEAHSYPPPANSAERASLLKILGLRCAPPSGSCAAASPASRRTRDHCTLPNPRDGKSETRSGFRPLLPSVSLLRNQSRIDTPVAHFVATRVAPALMPRRPDSVGVLFAQARVVHCARFESHFGLNWKDQITKLNKLL